MSVIIVIKALIDLFACNGNSMTDITAGKRLSKDKYVRLYQIGDKPVSCPSPVFLKPNEA